MGLLDQVIGQVIGQMAGAPPPHGNPPQTGGGFTLPAGINLPGGLGNVLSEAGGRYGPLALALLALLANKQIPSGAGGYGSVLHDILGRLGGAGGGGGAPAPTPDGDYGTAPTRTHGGGFLDEIGGMLGGTPAAPAGGTGGLGGLLDRLRQAGHGGVADSWVGTGANGSIAPSELEQALGPGTVDALAGRLGADRGHLLDQLAEALPQVVDGLTPGGEMPPADEQARWV